MKKGVELGMNTLIIAIIVLLVLVIIAYLLINQFNIFKTGTSCTSVGGTCKQEGCPGNEIRHTDKDGRVIPPTELCKSSGGTCCKII